MNYSLSSAAAATTTTTSAAATATATTTRPFTNPTPSRPLAPIPHLYPSQQQQQQPPPLFTPQSLSATTKISNPNPNSTNPHFPKPHDAHPPQGILYPVASSGRGFIPKPIRPQPPDQTVTVANAGAGAFQPRSIVAFPHHQVRPFGFSSNSDSLNHPVHMMRPPYLQQSHVGVAGNAGSAPIKGIPVSAHLKVASSPSSMPDCNGYKDSRDRSRDDTSVIVRDRKVRISDGASLYALCRSWLRNGLHEESQPQYGDGAKSLPRPLPMPAVDTQLLKRKEREEEEEDEEGEGSVEHLSAQDLLQRHVKRAKRVRARLREVRLQRIARYKTRLATLLPPPVEQFKDDTAAGN